MTLDELAATLPNGFHDAAVARLHVGYVARVVMLDLDLWVAADDDREARRVDRLVLTGVQYCVIEPPPSSYDYAAAKPLWIPDLSLPRATLRCRRYATPMPPSEASS